MSETLPVAEVRNHLSRLLAQVEQHHDRVTVTRNGREVAVMISPDDLASLEETVAVLADPDLMEQLGDHQARPSETISHDDARRRWSTSG